MLSELDIDIWSNGRDAANAGRFTTRMLKAYYPFVELNRELSLVKRGELLNILVEHFPDQINHQYTFKTWTITEFIYVFFKSKEDADYFRGLLYVL